jgi:hypothetical protein
MRRWVLRALAAIGALVAVLLAVAVPAATSTLPGFLDHHPARAWTLVAVLGLVSIGCAALSARAGEPSEQAGTAGRVQVGGVHAGRDLKIDGERNVVAGGDYSTHTNPNPSAPPDPATRPGRRRDRR